MKLSSNRSLHGKFEELAALAVVGELNAFEMQSLQDHLRECRDCREAYEAFADVASNDLGITAADCHDVECSGGTDADCPNTPESLRDFRARLTQRRSGVVHLGDQAKTQTLLTPSRERNPRPFAFGRVLYGLAAAMLLAVSIAAGTAWLRSARTISVERLRSRQLQATAESLQKDKSDTQARANASLERSLEDGRRERDALRKDRDELQKALTASQLKNADLLARETSSDAKLTQVIADTEKLREQLGVKDADRERLAKLQQESEGKLREALSELYQARQAVVQTASNTDSASDVADNTAPPTESEARDLFGARDLHILDVYDVASDGRTKRTHGRVYYVDKKLLRFYAFDLQDRQNHKGAVFQAWGYREADAHKALNLGLFTSDDSSVGRWVLTVNRPDVLSHIDAVFVTVEPPGGSNSPLGKKILYANLAWPANHP